jgi:hypothetical protein
LVDGNIQLFNQNKLVAHRNKEKAKSRAAYFASDIDFDRSWQFQVTSTFNVHTQIHRTCKQRLVKTTLRDSTFFEIIVKQRIAITIVIT